MNILQLLEESELLMEMPKTIPDLTNHALNNTIENRKYFDVISKESMKKLYKKINNDSIIYQYKKEFVCLNTKINKITYFMKFKVDHNKILGNYVWQSLVWRATTAAELSGIPEKIFFETLLPKYGCVVTDSEQTWNGTRFWIYRITDALKMNLFVYYYNFRSKELIKVNSIDEFTEIEEKYDIWGTSNNHEMKRIVITNRELIKGN